MTTSATAIALMALVLGGGVRLDDNAAWAALNDALQSHTFAANGRLQREARPDYDAQLAKLEALMPRCVGTTAEAHAHFNRANTLYFLDRFDEALSGLEALKAKFPKHGLCVIDAFLPDHEGLSMVDAAIADCRGEIEIRKNYEVKQLPTAVLDQKRSVIFHTRLGDFTMQFYPNVAPKTVANFLKLAREGFYNDTYFHSVRGLREVVGGCPNTKRSLGMERSDDGEGSPGYLLDLEPSSALHSAGAVAMRSVAATGKTSGSQFMICLTELPQYNNRQHVFGEITEGLDVVRLLSQQVADDKGNPYDRVWITGVEVREN